MATAASEARTADNFMVSVGLEEDRSFVVWVCNEESLAEMRRCFHPAQFTQLSL
jgi:hypothetical protein